MDATRFDRLTRSVVTISRRYGLWAGASAILGVRLGGLDPEEAEAKKKNKKPVRCAAGELRCGRKCCGPGFICRKSDKRVKGKKPKKLCASACGGDGSQCGKTDCGNGGPGSVCATVITTEGEEFCLDFVKANPVSCQTICRTSADCGPGGVCLCVDNPDPAICTCGEGVPTSCYVRADVECDQARNV